VFIDAGIERQRAIRYVGIAGFLLGLPSAISLAVLHNQAWVWGVALMVSGLFFSIAVITHGVRRFREQQLNHADSDVSIGAWWDVVVGVFVPLQAVILLIWWLYQARQWNPEGWLDPFGEDNVGTVLAQFVVVFVMLIAANRWLASHTHGASDDARAGDA
jgi:NSS family neurotransmitter:Na+ symporter